MNDIDQIIKTFHRRNIELYRIVINQFNNYNIVLSPNCEPSIDVYDNSWLRLIFCYSANKIGYIDVPSGSATAIEYILANYINNNQHIAINSILSNSEVFPYTKPAANTDKCQYEFQGFKYYYQSILYNYNYYRSRGFNITYAQHTRFAHKVSVYSNNSYNYSCSEKYENIIYYTSKNLIAKNIYNEKTNATAAYLDLEANCEKDEDKHLENITMSSLQGYVKFPGTIVHVMSEYFCKCLKGSSILSHQSFIKKDDIGKQIVSPHISLLDTPPAVYDSEGIFKNTKTLISNGVLENLICSLESSILLGVSPGNATVSFFSSAAVEDHSRIILTSTLPTCKISHAESCSIIEVLPPGFSFDSVSGLVSAKLLGTDIHGNLHIYVFHETIKSFFEKARYQSEKSLCIGKTQVPELTLLY